MDIRQQSRIAAGFTLVVVGIFLLFLKSMEGYGESVTFGALGAAFLGAYLWRKAYGLLIPAGVLLGLAVGSALDEGSVGETRWNLVGLAAGFFGIYVLDLVYRGKNRWWPAIPGALLLLVAFPWGEDLLELLLDHWPLILVLIGGILLLTAFGGGGRAEEPSATTVSEASTGNDTRPERPSPPPGSSAPPHERVDRSSPPPPPGREGGPGDQNR